MIHSPKTTALAGVALLAGAAAQAWELPVGNRSIDFHGFASQGFLLSSDYDYLGSTTDGGSFAFTELGINASMTPFKRTRIAVQGFTFDIGDVGNYELLLDYASIEYTFHQSFGIRGGRVRRPGGIYNHIQDVDLARTSVLLPQGMYDARWRDFSTSIDGGLLFGSVPIGKAGSISYEAYAGLIRLSDEGGVANSIRNTLPPSPIASYDGIDSSFIIGAQLWWATPVPGLRAGISGGYLPEFTSHTTVNPPYGVGAMRNEIEIPFVQASVEYVWNSWTFQAEYYTYGSKQETYGAGMLLADDKSATDSWYVSAAYRFNDWLEAGAYYTEYYADTADRSGDDMAVSSDAFQKDVALSFRFDIKDWWLVKLEGHYIRGTGLLQDSERNPVRDDDGWWLFAAKTTFSF